jgi:hypothetical protein
VGDWNFRIAKYTTASLNYSSTRNRGLIELKCTISASTNVQTWLMEHSACITWTAVNADDTSLGRIY